MLKYIIKNLEFNIINRPSIGEGKGNTFLIECNVLGRSDIHLHKQVIAGNDD